MCTSLRLMRKELLAYAQTPVAWLFSAAFIVAAGALTFYQSGFFARGIADLNPFFQWHPWLYLFFAPALSMRLWAEEWRHGTSEWLLTLPVSVWQLVVGKFLATWCLLGLTLLGTTPIWLTVSYLGDPDHGLIISGYLASFLTGGALLAIGSAASAATTNQIIAFIITLLIALIMLMAAHPLITEFFSTFASPALTSLLYALSLLTHYNAMVEGKIDLITLCYFIITCACWLTVTRQIIGVKQDRGV